MSEFRRGDEVWVKGLFDESANGNGVYVHIAEMSGYGDVSAYVDRAGVRKLEPDEVTQAKERVVKAAKEWGKVVAAAAPYDCPLIRAVNALEALEKPSLEDDLRIELEDLVFKVTDASSEDEGVAPAVTRILAIIEKHKGEE